MTRPKVGYSYGLIKGAFEISSFYTNIHIIQYLEIDMQGSFPDGVS